MPEKPIKATLVKVPNAYAALASLLEMVNSATPRKSGLEEMSFVSPTATLGEEVYVGAFAYIADNVKIGSKSVIHPQVYVGDTVTIGEECILYPGVKIYSNCVIGDRCIIHSGAVIGADGFGYSKESEAYHKIPQIGNVVIEEDVEVGANTTIDRATMGATIIRRGTKLDNLIQVAHNVEIGENSVLAAQTGIAGSTKIGKQVMFGGQVGIAGHLKIADGVKLAAQTGVSKSITKAGTSPSMDAMQYNKAYVFFRKLPELKTRIDELEKKSSNQQP